MLGRETVVACPPADPTGATNPMSDPARSDDALLIDLLLEWEERVAQGEVVSAADLCPNRPDLVPILNEQIARLKRIAPLAQPDPLAESADSSQTQNMVLAKRYRLEEIIGQGGFGVVWRAYDLKLRRPVAVKLPRLDSLQRSLVRKKAFLAEARRVAKFDHPGIVSVFDFGHDGVPFIVSELIAGNDLGRRQEAGPIPIREVIRIVVAVAEALGCAHRQGIIHRDIKPANILIGDDGRVRLTDFGIAASADAPGRGATGTISYMAPERLAGDPGLDRRADVYSLGAVLYELLTGRPPFADSALAGRPAGIGTGEPDPPRAVNPEVPFEIDQICLRCLAKDPGDRPPTADVLADNLAMWLAGPKDEASRGVLDRLWRWLTRAPRCPPDTVKGRETSLAQLADSWVGRQTFLKTIPINLSPDHRRALTMYCLIGSSLEVKSDTGDWIEVRVGSTKIRLRKDDVVLAGEAIDCFKAMTVPPPSDPEPYLLRAASLGATGRLELALDDCTRAVRLNPDYSLSWALRGWMWWSLGDSRKAMDDYEKAIRRDRAAPWAWIVRGMTWWRLSLLDLALDDYSEAVRLDPTDVTLLLSRGRLNELNNLVDDAINDFGTACRLDPACWQAWVECGRLAYNLAEFPRAIECATAAIGLDPTDPLPLVMRGAAYARQDKEAEALADFDDALDRKLTLDQQWVILLELGELAMKSSVPSRFKKWAMSLPPNQEWESTGGSLVSLAVANILSDDFSKAVNFLTRALDRSDLPSVYRNRTNSLRLLAQERL
jgi:serine/threonine-protein kinase